MAIEMKFKDVPIRFFFGFGTSILHISIKRFDSIQLRPQVNAKCVAAAAVAAIAYISIIVTILIIIIIVCRQMFVCCVYEWRSIACDA